MLLTMISAELLYSPASSMIRNIRHWVFNASVVDKYEIRSDGIPVIDLGKIKGERIGIQYIPIAGALTGLEHYARHDSISMDKFLNCTRWIIDNATRKDSLAFLIYNYRYPVYDMNPPWRSAMAQGLSLQLIARAYEITTDPYYLAFGDSLLNPMLDNIKGSS